MYIEVKDLPRVLQSALASVGYGRKDIQVTARERFRVAQGGSDGFRAFVVVVNLSTGERQVERGSWGGANMFNPRNPVDLDDASRVLPEGFAVVSGEEGGSRPVHAEIYASPRNLAALLPEGSEDTLTDRELAALRLFNLKGGPYRQDEARRSRINYSATDPLFVGLIERGYITANKAGAMQLTTKGRNKKPGY